VIMNKTTSFKQY